MDKIGLIAGSGQFPIMFAGAAVAGGLKVYAVAHVGETDPHLEDTVDAIRWVRIGQLKRIIEFFKESGVSDAIMAGGITKTSMFSSVRPDLKAIKMLATMDHTQDDAILRAFACVMENHGIAIRAATFLLPDLLAKSGCWTRRKPTKSEMEDVRFGWRIAKEIGRSDVGQSVVVRRGSVLAVEAIDGTDSTIRRGGALGKRKTVVVKTSKPNQDMRFDMPAVGPKTIETMLEAGACVLAIEADRTVVIDREKMVSLANRNKISIVCVDERTFLVPHVYVEKTKIDSRGGEVHKAGRLRAGQDAKRLRVGVVGVGYLGRFHAEKYARMDGVELAGVVDIVPERAQDVAKRLGTRHYADYRELIGKVDAVSVVVPTPVHFSISRHFLENDVDVLIEKPMTETLDQADTLIKIADSRGPIIQVGHLERFNPAVIALKEVVDRPLFIESHRLHTFKERGTDVDVVLDLMIHDIDIILNLVQSEVKSVHAVGVPVVSSRVDIANVRLLFENGCVANITASRISVKNMRKIRIFQKETYVSVDYANNDITFIRKGSNGVGLPIPGWSLQQKTFDDADSLESELGAFVKAVRFREAPLVSGRDGRNALGIALSIAEQIEVTNRRFLGDKSFKG